ncbi:hypothetical protein OG884_01500 [Streptosporangium sp. NBC_01755]|uniref:hypothetical protein n=1 Tax=Streptosporangium sp. NBC_01755 TaxID=2975949 RepID=UPI002DD940B7|nr:hypothetical protein [Streptosporangium sp. NBC_01755]WSD00646.1 hypothetical protein OG884_01500 [Streptosporangium sp. NBC_01755]
MYLINAHLRAPEIEGRLAPPGGRMSAREIRRLLLMLAEPEEGLEHVYGEDHADGVDLGLFIRRPTLDAAESAAARLCARCLDGVPGLAGWSLAGCGTDLVLALARFKASGGQACQRPAIAAR